MLRLPSLIFILLLTLLTPARAEPQPAKPPQKPIILVLGDSLSAGYGLDAQAGYVALLQQRLDREGYDYRVVNASVSGDTTSGGLARLPPALDRHRPAIVLIELGGNDGLRALPLKALHDNLLKLVDLSLAAQAKVLLLEIRIPPNYGAVYTEGFTRTFGQVAAERKVPLVPFFLMSLVGVPGAFQDDGIHPAAVSQPKMLDALWPSLKTLLK
ncbi:arylesterase [Hydrocarboniphaga sp.]|uniref:arylesterase n=1 Tax=Hydrocarboniphaga sp. TaxID=2033016 RepID=UPI003D0C2965